MKSPDASRLEEETGLGTDQSEAESLSFISDHDERDKAIGKLEFREFLLNAPDFSRVDVTRDPGPMREFELSLDPLPD